VDTPRTYASITTVNSARSMRRRRSRIEGRKLPRRSLRIRSSTSPVLVDNNRAGAPLRWFVRVSARSWRSALITSVASASMSAWSITPTPRRLTSPLPPARMASSSWVGSGDVNLLLAMSLGKVCSLKNHENKKPW
jgi:hypothetical protein